jgi:membrane protease YdiL (CAAX protease family)
MDFSFDLVFTFFKIGCFLSIISYSIYSFWSLVKEHAFSVRGSIAQKTLRWSSLIAVIFFYFASFCLLSLFSFLLGGEKTFFGLAEIQYYLLISTLSSLLAIVLSGLYISTLSLKQKEEIIGKVSLEPIKRGIQWGIACMIIPYLLLFTIHLVLFFVKHTPPEEQAAFTMVRVSTSSWWLFILVFLSINLVTPILEELIFRGILQNLFSKSFTPFISIVLTSTLFALTHYANEQGASNIAYIISIFSLSYFLGVLYEREKSLLASIVMHSTFNTISILFFV